MEIKNKITWDRLSEIATKCMHELLENDSAYAKEFFKDELDLTEEECTYFEVTTELEEDDEDTEFNCTMCPYHYYDEGEDYPSCHHTSDDLTAPCEYEPEENSYEEEPWGYADRNYNRLSED